MSFKVLQITAAQPGWISKCDRPHLNEYDIDFVAVWAIVENEKGQRVVGLIEQANGSLKNIEDDPEFIGYEKLDDDDPILKREIRKDIY